MGGAAVEAGANLLALGAGGLLTRLGSAGARAMGMSNFCRAASVGVGAASHGGAFALAGGVMGGFDAWAHGQDLAQGIGAGAFGGLWRGMLLGAASGLINPLVCFVAGTQVVVGAEAADADDPLPAMVAESGSTVAVATRVRYITKAIEELVACGGGEMGSGGGQYLLARDQNDPDGPLVRCRIVRTYQRAAYRLQALTLRDADGTEQTLRVTPEHPFHVLQLGWTPARSLVAGDRVRGISGKGVLEVIDNAIEDHPEGVAVYNLEVEHAHTYFVRAEGSEAEPVWVHNECRLTPYEEDGGHHVFSKKAFEGMKGYNKDAALSIGKSEIDRLGLNHLDEGGITATQRRLFDELAASNRPNTLAEHARIAEESLVAGGLSRAEAKEVVVLAQRQLESWGITAPARIPWN